MVFANDIWNSCNWAIIINLILIGEGLIGMLGSLRSCSLKNYFCPAGKKQYLQVLFSRTALISGVISLGVTIICSFIMNSFLIDRDFIKVVTLVIALCFICIPLGRAQLYLKNRY